MSASPTQPELTESGAIEQAKQFVKEGRADKVAELLRHSRTFFANLPRSKSANIIRTLIELTGQIPNTERARIDMCKEWIGWTVSEERTFLRLRIEVTLASLYLEVKDYVPMRELIEKLLKEVKRMEDHRLLVEIHLLESQLMLALHDVPKSRAALTQAKTEANAVYMPPVMQAKLDLQSGLLHAAERDHKTAYSYFYEAFENFDNLKLAEAALCLKYLLLGKIMMNKPEEVSALLTGRIALKYAGRDVDAMKQIASAQEKRSLHEFQKVLKAFPAELTEDEHVNVHLQSLHDTLFESHLKRIIEPFSCVEIDHVAHLIGLPVDEVETKLSEMILDKKLTAILDQETRCLNVFAEVTEDKTYQHSIATLDSLNKVLDALSQKATLIK
ncbi:putative 26S proteasome non-ATPase regulatory subunit 11 [Paratrimastix pyriformis]|uniref:26S proteasome non-ATPase regulatory subunit 11 n=1 Tax=Paratrimastix pyriformis TaxID=342808 RepID=A0ABQ8UUI3_9EUKA|nr:putative 26S proteasome non-ATPase regulatory subunit 11 [Paratrimastix pyriformis]